ncbi:MAG: hypothetical protein GC168_01700 [Candidatus Hydrogenedens sp.]|nr:hypothetical protein [Candidatus Hydrogenedens sp.]
MHVMLIRRAAKALFWLGAVALWCMVGAMLLQFGSRPGFYWRTLSGNPYMEAQHGDAPWPPPPPAQYLDDAEVSARVAAENPGYFEGKGPGAETEAALPDWVLPLHPDDDAERLTALDRFAALSPADQERFLALRGETLLEWHADSDSIAVRGTGPLARLLAWMLDDWAGHRTLERWLGVSRGEFIASLESAARDYATAAFQPAGSPVAMAFACVESGGIGRAFTRAHYKQLLSRDSDGDASRYEIPYYSYRPSFQGEERPPVFQTNTLGLRDDEIALPKPPGVFRIVCIGGSTTEYGANNASTYPNLLQADLSEKHPGRVIDVVNAGIPGMTAADHARKAAFYFSLQPDLLLVYVGVNDAVQVNPAMLDQAPEVFGTSMLGATTWWKRPPPAAADAIVAEEILPNLDALTAAARLRGCDIGFCTPLLPDETRLTPMQRDFLDRDFPMRWRQHGMDFSSYAATIQEYGASIRGFCQQQGALFLPLNECFDSDVDRFLDFCHLRDNQIPQLAHVMLQCLEPYLRRTALREGSAARIPDRAYSLETTSVDNATEGR